MFQMIDRPFTVSFFGHRYVENFSEVERTVERILSELFQRNEMIELLVGKDGEFDQIVSSSIKRAKKQYGDYYCSHVVDVTRYANLRPEAPDTDASQKPPADASKSAS